MRFPFECGPLVKCLDGQPRKAFSVSLYIDESMRKEKAIAPAGEEKELPKEMTLDDILDLKDLITQPPTMSTGRGKELLVEEGTIFFLEVQNRDPKTQAHVTIMMNTDVQGIWRLRPNEKLNIRHPALGDKTDSGKWEVGAEEKVIDADMKKGKTVNHTNRISRSGIISGKGGTVEIRFEPENNLPNTRDTPRNKTYELAGEEFVTAWGKIPVAAVQSSTFRMAVVPPADKSAQGVTSDELQAAMVAQSKMSGESARISQSDHKFSCMLYKPVTSPLQIDTKKTFKETFSFQISKHSEGSSSEPCSKKAKPE